MKQVLKAINEILMDMHTILTTAKCVYHENYYKALKLEIVISERQSVTDKNCMLVSTMNPHPLEVTSSEHIQRIAMSLEMREAFQRIVSGQVQTQ